MVVRIQLFGPEAAHVGADFIDVPMGESATCESLLDELHRRYPQICGRIAVNHAFASPGQRIEADDEVALIGLVSGG